MRKTKISSRLLSGVLLLTMAGTVAAKSVYVNDTLRVGLRTEPSSGAAPVGVVKTGMKLELLERGEDYSQVRTEKGQTGWIKNIYVVDKLPAGIQLQKVQKKQAVLQAQVKELKESKTLLETANRALNEKVDTMSSERSRWQLEQARQQVELDALSGSSNQWIWWLSGLLLTAGAGFFSGISWYRHSVTRRLGGLKI